MTAFLLWYLLISLVGWLAFPLAYRLLPNLPDRGYALSRTLGWLVWGFTFWLLASLGILRNTAGGLLLALALVVGLAFWALRSTPGAEINAWLHNHMRLAGVVEVLFLAAFAGWAVVRAANPEAVATEKPMELAFINAILRSEIFPPHDPWLSGYSISYYHFGYVLVAMLARLTGVSGAVAFNLGTALVFALSAVGAYSLVYNLLDSRRRPADGYALSNDQESPGRSQPARLAPLLGPLFLLVVSNIEGFLHVLHNRGLFWTRGADGQFTSSFWSWLGILDLDQAPVEPFTWLPTRFWSWWRASRVVSDYTLAGTWREIIDEFPFFSYLLADLHPHVLAMPFAFLAMGLAFNVYLGAQGPAAGRPGVRWLNVTIGRRAQAWLWLFAAPGGALLFGLGVVDASVSKLILGAAGLAFAGALWLRSGFSLRSLGQTLRQDDNEAQRLDQSIRLAPAPYFGPAEFALAALALGGMSFLNTWDFPVYVALYSGAYTLARQQEEGWSWQRLKEFVLLGLALGIGGVVLYLPFYVGFSSQAGGLLPNLINPTRGAHLWVMFAPLLAPIFAYLLYLIWQGRQKDRTSLRRSLASGFGLALAGMLGLLALGVLLGMAINLIPAAAPYFLGSLETNEFQSALTGGLVRRLTSPGGWLTLLALVGATLGLLILRPERSEAGGQEGIGFQDPKTGRGSSKVGVYAQFMEAAQPLTDPPTHPENRAARFALLLILVGGLLVVFPEFFFLRDQFGWRMNTIFKFYYQAWLLWSAAAAFASIVLWQSLRGAARAVFGLAWTGVLLMGLVYPVFSLWNKTNAFQPAQWTLDGSAYLQSRSPDEWAGIAWLQKAPLGAVAEAVPVGGGSYSDSARVATFSGQPALLGWVGHESQWRGGGEEMGSRQADLSRLYCTRDWTETLDILETYAIRYIFIGGLEWSTYARSDACPYGLQIEKFEANLVERFRQGDVVIFEVIP